VPLDPQVQEGEALVYRTCLLSLTALSLLVAALFTSISQRSDTAHALHAMPCPDINGDGVVAVPDSAMLLSHGPFPAPVPPAPAGLDLDGDTDVDLADNGIVLGAFGAVGLICQDAPVGLGPVLGPASNTDADGCADVEEIGPAPAAGGMRDIYNHWDFFDVPTGTPLARDQVIAGTDFFGLLSRFGAVDLTPPKVDPPLVGPIPPAPAYHSSYDRSPAVAPLFPVDLGPPDGAIAAFDFFAMFMQFGHTCAAPP
jgi:hypothetical protein